MKNILIAMTIFVSSLANATSLLTNVSLTDLAKTNKPLYIQVNKSIPAPTQYNSVQIEKSKGGFFSSDKYTLRLTFRFKRKGPLGAKDGSGSISLPINKGSRMQVSGVQVNPSHYPSSDAYYLSAEGPSVNLGDGQSTNESIYLQILGNNSNNISKLTVGELEKLFDNAITIYSGD